MAANTPLTIALSKGRLFEQTLPLLAAADIQPLDDPATSRKLIIATTQPQVHVLIVRASDVPTYVQYGAADIGVAGKDVLLEHGADGLYEPLDLGIARCRLMVAGPANALIRPYQRRLRVATKYVRSAQRYFAAHGRQVEIIKLYGSMELAPLVGLADVIVDLVESGNTLKANGLIPLELIEHISARVIVNKAAWKMKHAAVKQLISVFKQAVLASMPPPPV